MPVTATACARFFSGRRTDSAERDSPALSSTSLSARCGIVQHGRSSGGAPTRRGARAGLRRARSRASPCRTRTFGQGRPEALVATALAGALARRRAAREGVSHDRISRSSRRVVQHRRPVHLPAATFPRLVVASQGSRASFVNVSSHVLAMAPSWCESTRHKGTPTFKIGVVPLLRAYPNRLISGILWGKTSLPEEPDP